MLRGEAPFALREDVRDQESAPPRASPPSPGDAAADLLDALKALRGAIARAPEPAGLCHFPRPHADRNGEARRPRNARRTRRHSRRRRGQAAEIRRGVPRRHPETIADA